MKICLVCSEYPPGPHGGIGIVNQVLARALVKRGHEVRVVGIYPSASCEEEEDAGVRVWRLPSSGRPFGWIHDRIVLYRMISRWSRASEIDLVEVSDWGGPAAFWPKLTVPVIGRVHGSGTHLASEMKRPVRRVMYWLERHSMRRADDWVSVSRYAAECAQKLFGLQPAAAILYNPVTLAVEPHQIQRSRNQVLFTGTLLAMKGVASLIKAWPAVRAACPEAELHLLGKDGRAADGSSMQAFLQSQPAAQSVFFHGHVGRETVLRHLLAARVAVFPSYSEAFALAPLEAMGCGCPTIYTRRSSGPELIQDGENGLLIDPDRPQEIAQAIVRVLKDDDLATRLGAAGARRISEDFSLETIVQANEEFYERCVAGFHGREVTPQLQHLNGWRKPAEVAGVFDDCCLIVPTYKRPATVVKLLQKLSTLPDLPAEMVIIDGSPDTLTGDAVVLWARERELPFELVYVRSPAGLTRQRNVGIDASTKELVFFLDDDCLPEPGYFRAMRDVFLADAAQAVGAVAGSPINEMDKPLMWRWRIRFFLGIVPRDGEPNRYYPMATSVPRSLAAPFHGTRPTDILPGATFACRRSVFRQERFSMFFAGYSQGEDLEMSLRIGRKWQILWSGDARCVHEHTPGGRPSSFPKGRMEVRNRYFIWKRHTPAPRLIHRVQLWADFLYIFGYDLASFAAHPRQGGFLSHACGVATGAVECLVTPPHYQDPPARREYDFDLEPLPAERPATLVK